MNLKVFKLPGLIGGISLGIFLVGLPMLHPASTPMTVALHFT
jgi:hypothetical protein